MQRTHKGALGGRETMLVLGAKSAERVCDSFRHVEVTTACCM